MSGVKVQTNPIAYAGQDRVLYIGKLPSDSRLYASNVYLFAISLNGQIEINHAGESFQCKSFLMPPNVTHKASFDKEDTIAWIILEPTHIDCEIIKRSMTRQYHNCYIDIMKEGVLKNLFYTIYNQQLSASSVRHVLNGVMGLTGSTEYASGVKDMRILKSMDRINAHLTKNIPSQELAEEVGLSNGRLQQLFKQQVQMSLRQYRRWRRLKYACELTAEGRKFSDVAINSGFSDAAHFSRAFQNTFGKPASSLLGAANGVSFIY